MCLLFATVYVDLKVYQYTHMLFFLFFFACVHATPCMMKYGNTLLPACFGSGIFSQECRKAQELPTQGCESDTWLHVYRQRIGMLRKQTNQTKQMYLWTNLDEEIIPCHDLVIEQHMTPSCFTRIKQKCVGERKKSRTSCGQFFSSLHQTCFLTSANSFLDCIYNIDEDFIAETILNYTSWDSSLPKTITQEGYQWIKTFGCTDRANRNPPFPCPCVSLLPQDDSVYVVRPCQHRRHLLKQALGKREELRRIMSFSEETDNNTIIIRWVVFVLLLIHVLEYQMLTRLPKSWCF